MNTATNQVVEGQLSPMTGTQDSPRIQVTGQWLYDNFVQSGEEQISRMNMVRILAKQATDADLKSALKDAIEIAHKHDVKAGVPEKDRGPKRQQAMNVRTIMQNAYGALRRAPQELEALGYNERTGYQEMRVLAKKALDSRGIKWDGTKVKTDSDKLAAQEQAAKQQKADAMAVAMAETTQGEGEEDITYFLRVKAKADAVLAQLADETADRKASKLAADIATKQDRGIVERVIGKLTAFLSNTSEEMTDEEVDEVLRKAGMAEEESQTSDEEVTNEETQTA
jgi:hypothetical protein